jgi:hypothetical protein
MTIAIFKAAQRNAGFSWHNAIVEKMLFWKKCYSVKNAMQGKMV